MSETAELQAPPTEGGPGHALVRLRTERKLSVADVAQRLKYGARQIEALEAGEFDRLPGATFVRGMVRGYAKLLEVDSGPLLDSLDRCYVPGEVSLDLRAKRVPFPQGGKRSGNRVYLFFSLIVVAVLVAVVYEWRVGVLPWAKVATARSPQAQPRPKLPLAPAEEIAPASAALPVAPPHVEKPAAVAASVPLEQAKPQPSAPPQGPVSEGKIRMEFEGESWVEIKDGEGKMLMSQLNPTGSRRVVSGRAPLSLVIGNAANVRLTYNDKPVDLKPYIQIEVARLTLE